MNNDILIFLLGRILSEVCYSLTRRVMRSVMMILLHDYSFYIAIAYVVNSFVLTQ